MHLAYLLVVVALYCVDIFCLREWSYERRRKRFGVPKLKGYPSWDPVYGLDYVYAMMRAIKTDKFLEFQKKTYNGPQAWSAKFFGKRMIHSLSSENMRAISTTHRDFFAIEPIRVGNGAITPFTGRGVSSSDGAKWKESRGLVMPYFDRSSFTNLQRLEVHVGKLLSKIPDDGSTVDVQPLFQRWVSGLTDGMLMDA
ncbi:Cytochrome P450 [Moelleriella libera RCEF 2490]|uniref:Cytochrome P450 n=1 Tax=Moelleriella libera RCEF 2490 TaxID=1081109 RepID=A0A167VHY1_9HYPO|nr:Cytochrome P450 [Moelleriella libera RCEF 2490]